MTHICVNKLTIIGSDNGLSPDRRQTIVWTNAGLLLIGPLGTNFSEILIEILTFSFKKMCLKVSSAKRQPFCLGLNVLKIALLFSQRDRYGSLENTLCAMDALPKASRRQYTEQCLLRELNKSLAGFSPRPRRQRLEKQRRLEKQTSIDRERLVRGEN